MVGVGANAASAGTIGASLMSVGQFGPGQSGSSRMSERKSDEEIPLLEIVKLRPASVEVVTPNPDTLISLIRDYNGAHELMPAAN